MDQKTERTESFLTIPEGNVEVLSTSSLTPVFPTNERAQQSGIRESKSTRLLYKKRSNSVDSQPAFERSSQVQIQHSYDNFSNATLKPLLKPEVSSKYIYVTLILIACGTLFAIATNMANPVFILQQLDETVTDEVGKQLKDLELDSKNCPELWLPYRKSCYLKLRDKIFRNFSVADGLCSNELNGFLAHPRSIAEFNILKSLSSGTSTDDIYLWLGANRQTDSWVSVLNEVR